MKKSIAMMLLTSALTACSGGGNKTPQQGQWTNFAVNYYPLSNPFSLQQLLGYVYTRPYGPLMIGQTITLNYSIDGNSSYAVHENPGTTDGPPASITLFIWETVGDTTNESARWWCGNRAIIQTGDSQSLSCSIDYNWTNVTGTPAQVFGNVNPEFTNTLSHAQGVGFTFGGANFYGHGVTGTGNAVFKINQWTIQ